MERRRPGRRRAARAWLAKVVTNLCLNRLTSARARREQYPGPWLPEPVATGDGTLGPLESAEQRDAVSTALLMLTGAADADGAGGVRAAGGLRVQPP